MTTGFSNGAVVVDDASTSRTNLGLGTIATQAANNVSISGGAVTGITDIAVADGGTGSSTASGARSNLSAAASGANTDITSLGSTAVVQIQGYRPVNAQTGTTYTLALTDAGEMVTLSNASAITLTIPTNASVAFVTNTEIDLAQLGAGQVTISPAGGVTLNSYSSLVKLAGQYAGASLRKTATDTWLLVGNIA